MDACAAGSKLLRNSADLPDAGTKQSPHSAVFSTMPGSKGIAGFFGSVLFPLLEQQNWPPDFDSVFEKLHAEASRTQLVATVQFRVPGRTYSYSPPVRESNRSQYLHLFCDRTSLVGRFKLAAEARKQAPFGTPQLWMIRVQLLWVPLCAGSALIPIS